MARAEGLELQELMPVARVLLAEEPRTFNELRALLLEAFPQVNDRALGYAVRTHLEGEGLLRFVAEDATAFDVKVDRAT